MPKRNSGHVFLGSAAVLFVLTALSVVVAPGSASVKTVVPSPAKSHKPEPTYKVQAGVDGEVYPVFANFASLQKPQERKRGSVAVTVTNSADTSIQNRISVQVVGWSDEEIQDVELGAGKVGTYQFAPTFLPRLYRNHEIVAATALVTVRRMGGQLVYRTTVPLRLRSVDDIYWGPNFEYAPFIASWVTPHDPWVERVLSRAKEFAPGRRLPGYESSTNPAVQERSTYIQARAIYRALQSRGVSYVKSSMTFGKNLDISERVRMPRESLDGIAANCIDGTVMYAALFENLGMEPVVVLVPHHAYVGVRVAPNSVAYLFIETALTGRASFDRAVRAAQAGMKRYPASEVIRIPIADARQAGIYPMPLASKN